MTFQAPRVPGSSSLPRGGGVPPPDATIVAGLDLAAGRGTTALALLALRAGRRPRLVAAPHPVATDDDILTLLNESRASIVAVDAPLTLPASVAAALRGETDDMLLTTSPYTRAAERDPLWSHIGVRPLPVSFLGGLTLRALVLAARLQTRLPDVRLVETFPSAVLRILKIRDAPDMPPSPAPGTADAPTSRSTHPRQRRLAKTALPVRRATQRGLARWIDGLHVPSREPGPLPYDATVPPRTAVDDAAGVLSADALDALAAALTAVAVAVDAVCYAGTTEEGQIVLPDAAQLARALALPFYVEESRAPDGR